MIVKSQNKPDFRLIKHRIKEFNKRIISAPRNPNKIRLTLDPKQQNPVYSYMKQEKVNKNVLQFMINSAFGVSPASKRRTQSQKFILQKMHSPNFRAFSKNERQNTQKDVQNLRLKGQNIFLDVDSVQNDLKRKKERIKILDKYINKVDRYCSFIPQTYEQNEKEILIAHDQIQKLCKQEFFKRQETLVQRANSVVQYTQPKVNYKVFQHSKYGKFKRHKRVSTAPLETPSKVTFATKRFTINL